MSKYEDYLGVEHTPAYASGAVPTNDHQEPDHGHDSRHHGHGQPDVEVNGMVYAHGRQYPAPHTPEKAWTLSFKTVFALAVAWAIATILAFFGFFLPKNGIPAGVGITFGIIALFCIIFIWASVTRWQRWLMASGVGLGFYVIMVLVFWA